MRIKRWKRGELAVDRSADAEARGRGRRRFFLHQRHPLLGQRHITHPSATFAQPDI